MKNIHCLGALKRHTLSLSKGDSGDAEVSTFNILSVFAAQESPSCIIYLKTAQEPLKTTVVHGRAKGFPNLLSS